MFPHLVKLISSSNPSISNLSLKCIRNITAHFPEEVVKYEALPALIKCLKPKNNKKILGFAAACFKNISCNQKNISDIIKAGECIESLINLLAAKDNFACEKAFEALFNILSSETCKHMLDHGVLENVKNLFYLLAHKLLLIKFIEKIISFDENYIDLVIEKDLIPLILEQINAPLISPPPEYKNGNDDVSYIVNMDEINNVRHKYTYFKKKSSFLGSF